MCARVCACDIWYAWHQVFFGGGAALDHFWWLRLAPDSISEHTDNEALAMIKNREATIDEFIVVRGCCMWPKTENFRCVLSL